MRIIVVSSFVGAEQNPLESWNREHGVLAAFVGIAPHVRTWELGMTSIIRTGQSPVPTAAASSCELRADSARPTHLYSRSIGGAAVAG